MCLHQVKVKIGTGHDGVKTRRVELRTEQKCFFFRFRIGLTSYYTSDLKPPHTTNAKY